MNPNHIFNALGCGSQDFNVTLTITNAEGCSSSSSQTVTVLRRPDIEFEDASGNNFDNCANVSTNYTVTVNNTSSSQACITSYSINWGDGSPVINVTNASFPITHTYTYLSSFYLEITANGDNSCSNSVTYFVKNSSNPAGGITNLEIQQIFVHLL